MANISLTASMRSNLLSLQKTQNLMDLTQERLSTGNKVNSAIDNPTSYYASQSLTNRANDLNALMDSMSQGVQTIKAADEGIKAITSFAEQAKAIANSARDTPSNFDKFAITSKEVTPALTLDDDTIILDTRADLSKVNMTFAPGDADKSFSIYIDGVEHTVALDNIATPTAADMANNAVNKLQGLGLNAKVTNAATGAIEISSTDGAPISWVNTDLSGATPGGGTAAKVITLTAANRANSATLAAAINTAVGANGIVATPDGNKFSVTSPNQEFMIYGTAASKLGIGDTKNAGDPNAQVAARISYANQFDQILKQIDELAKDSGYKGVNLLQENDLKVVFNEDRSSTLKVSGGDASSKGLAISQAQNDWQMDTNIDKSINDIESAISSLRTMATELGTNYSIIQSREDFTDNLIGVLEEGSDKLVLADMNEESANMLALQTRQQLAINSLSLASQAAQSVLKLF